MKTINKYNKILGAVGLLTLVLLTGACNEILEEQPRSSYTAAYFKTPEGIEAGLTAVYSDLRRYYGPVAPLYYTLCGTDEATFGDNKDAYGAEIDVYNIQANTNGINTVWNNVFPFINTCNGIIEIGTEVGVDAALIAEAKFLRAHDYFLLVTTYGGAPLDLGSGELKLNTNPVRFSKRNSIEEVYAVIFKDLQEAIEVLPATPRVTSGANKILAQHYLGKAYLTYGWWLERNSKTDPAGKSPAQYYQLAYDVTVEAIKHSGPFKLQSTFRDVNLAANDRNAEILFCAEHTDLDYTYDDSNNNTTSGPHGDMKTNRSSLAITPDFEIGIGGTQLVYRVGQQDVGRPWRLIAPTYETLTQTFADKTNDSRYEGTFTTVHRANYQSLSNWNGAVRTGLNNLPVNNGDTAFYYAPEEIPGLLFDSQNRFAYLPDKPYAIWTPSLITRHNYPACWKFGPDRTDKVPNAGSYNAASTRPFPIAKLSETHLIAAEAAVKGATPQAGYSARELVLVLRKRAAKPGREAEMESLTPSPITIDYILAERSRELWGECHRRYDLIRTGKLEQYGGSYSICENRNTSKQTFTRTIQPHHYLLPIPYTQFDNMDMSDEEKKAYQNPGY
jgi:hypothetical protein